MISDKDKTLEKKWAALKGGDRDKAHRELNERYDKMARDRAASIKRHKETQRNKGIPSDEECAALIRKQICCKAARSKAPVTLPTLKFLRTED